MRRRLPALLLALPLALAACGSDAEEAAPDAGGTTSPTAEAEPTGTSETFSPEGLPEIAGTYGETPVIAVPEGEPPAELRTEVLVEGEGEQVESGNVLVADYVGQTWTGEEPFDSSFQRGDPAAFPIGTGAVIQGWDDALVGQQIGSRVLLAIPPELGYGEQGQPPAIEGGATLVFVVDLVAQYAPDATATGEPTGNDIPEGLPRVAGGPGEQPEVTLAEGTEPPAEATSTVLLEGDGEALDLANQLVLQFVAVDYATGEVQASSYDQGTPLLVRAEQLPGLAEALEGQAVGSRIVLGLPAQEAPAPEGDATPAPPQQPAVPAAAFVIDVIGQV